MQSETGLALLKSPRSQAQAILGQLSLKRSLSWRLTVASSAMVNLGKGQGLKGILVIGGRVSSRACGGRWGLGSARHVAGGTPGRSSLGIFWNLGDRGEDWESVGEGKR